jgi:FkbM family methyltransferase
MLFHQRPRLSALSELRGLPHPLSCRQCLKLAAFRQLRAAAEPELMLVQKLVREGAVAVDVGSHAGTYAHEMARRGSGATLAFEPNPDLHPCADGTKASPYLLLPIALSDRCGSAVMRVPVTHGIRRYGRSSISAGNHFCTDRLHRELAVQTRTLDSFGLPPVGFIKIDVEGHELAVLRGAERTIERDRPNVLVESERRHNPASPGAVFRFFRRRGYTGFQLAFGRLHRIARGSRRGRAARLLAVGAGGNFVFLPD